MPEPPEPPHPEIPEQPIGSPDDEKLGGLIEQAVRKVFAEATRPSAEAKPGGEAAPVAPPPGDGSGGIAAMISDAVNRALREKDAESREAALWDEIDTLKKKLSETPAPRKRGWGSYLLGPGLAR